MAESIADIKALAKYDSAGDKSANQPVAREAGTSEKNDVVEMIYDRHKQARSDVLNWREDANECENFRSGHQWDLADLEILREQNRPAITFDRIHPIVEVISGTEISNRQEIRFAPRHPDSEQSSAVSDLATNAFSWANDLCYADDERSLAFKDLIIRGMGWTEQTLDYDSDLDGRYKLERWDGLEAWWDTSSRGMNLADTRWRGRKKWWRTKDIFDHWDDKREELTEAQLGGTKFGIEFDDDFPTTIETVTPFAYMPDNQSVLPGRPPRGFWPVIQHQWWDKEDVYRVVDPQDPEGPLKEYDKDQFKLLRERIDQARLHKRFPLNFVKQKRMVYYEAFMTRGVLLEKKKLAIQDGFTLKCMTGFWDQKKKVWYGLVRAMIEPQRAANKWLSQGLHIVNANAKGGLMVETDAPANVRRFEDEWSSPDKITWMKPGALSNPNGPKIKEKIVPTFPAAIVTMIQYAIESLRDVTGVSVEMLGQTEGDVPGVSQRQRQQQGMTILAHMFMSLTRFRKEEAVSAMALIRDYIADGRLIRIGGDYNSQAVPLLKDPLTMEYDLIIDESPRNPNIKAEVWANVGPMLPVLVKLGAFPPKLMDFMPGIPASMAHEIKQSMQQAMQAQQQAAQQQQQPKQGSAPPDPNLTAAQIEKLRAEAQLALQRADALEKATEWERHDTLLKAAVELEKSKGGGPPKMSQDLEHASGMQDMRHKEEMHHADVAHRYAETASMANEIFNPTQSNLGATARRESPRVV